MGGFRPFLKVARRKYRFRILNGSNARFYDLVLSNRRKFVMIDTDSNLLQHPTEVSSFRIGPAERVIVDFSAAGLGEKIYLVNRLEQDDGRNRTRSPLSDCIEHYGLEHPGIKSWGIAQEAVFANYSEGQSIQTEPDPDLPQVSRQDRAYQIAAAYFYSENYDLAAQRFHAIAADKTSPWSGTGVFSGKPPCGGDTANSTVMS